MMKISAEMERKENSSSFFPAFPVVEETGEDLDHHHIKHKPDEKCLPVRVKYFFQIHRILSLWDSETISNTYCITEIGKPETQVGGCFHRNRYRYIIPNLVIMKGNP